MLRAAVAALLSAALYAVAFAPLAWSPCAWFALVPILLVMRNGSTAFAVGWASVFALVACALSIGWIAPAAAEYYSQPLYAGVAVFLGIALLMVVPYVVLFTYLYRRFVRLWPHLAATLAACVWTATEFGRSHLLTGNPFALFAYSQSTVPVVIQIADLASVYGIGFLLVFTNLSLTEALQRWHAGRAWRGCVAPLLPAVVLIVATLVYGSYRIAAEPAVDAISTRHVLIAQGNLDLGSQWREDLYGRNLEQYLRITWDGLRQGPVDLVVWPENAMTFFVEREPAYQYSIASVLETHSVELISGGPRVFEGPTTRFFNSAFLLDPTGAPRAVYDKQRLLPFAEYFPWSQVDILRRNFGRVKEFSPGADTPPLPTRIGRAGMLICNEAMFPELAALRTRAGAELLVNLTNDTWIGDPRYGVMAAEMAVLRAVEQRRWLVRASTSGPSLIIDAAGRVQARSAASSTTGLRGDIVPRHEQTVYARFGDGFAYACVGLALVAFVASLWRDRVCKDTMTG